MTKKQMAERHSQLRERAMEKYIGYLGVSWDEVINCLQDYDASEYNVLEHKMYGQCEFCPDGNPKKCDYANQVVVGTRKRMKCEDTGRLITKEWTGSEWLCLHR